MVLSGHLAIQPRFSRVYILAFARKMYDKNVYDTLMHDKKIFYKMFSIKMNSL